MNQNNERRTNFQIIEVYLFKKTSQKIKFLLLRRIKEQGGFWQPVTGGVMQGESIKEAIKREIKEETGIKNIKKIINTGYSFKFFDDNQWHYEKVFGAEVKKDITITLSWEHTKFKWVTKEEAISKYLKWPDNKKGLLKLCSTIEDV